MIKLPRNNLGVACAFVVMAAAFLGAGAWIMAPIRGHRGDGQFQDITRFLGPIPIRGYTISMSKFDMGEPYQAEYHVAELPNIGQHCGVYLAFDDPADSWVFKDTKNVGGQLRLELLNSRGTVLVDTSGKLGDYLWYGEFGGRSDFHALYKLDESFFVPDRREEYLLRVSYVPDPSLRGYKGYAYLRSGGSD